MKCLCVTVPRTIKWTDYEKELKSVEDWSQVMNFRVPTMPRDIDNYDRCYLCYCGAIKGWQKIVGHEKSDGFDCITTGKHWDKGNYIQRSGPFHYLENPVPMKGFMGFRIIDDSEFK